MKFKFDIIAIIGSVLISIGFANCIYRDTNINCPEKDLIVKNVNSRINCRNLCDTFNLNPSNNSVKVCKAIVFVTNRKECRLKFCTLNPTNDKPVANYILDICIPVPNSAPPTPIPFVSPTGIPDDAPVKYELYTNDFLKPNLCQIAQPRQGTNFITIKPFNGNQDQCVRECTYDSYCRGVSYSQVERKCIKMSTIEITDHPAKFKSNTFVSFAKLNFIIPFRQGKCNGYARNSCNNDPECSVNQGQLGYNQELSPLTGFPNSGFYCGRIKCN